MVPIGTRLSTDVVYCTHFLLKVIFSLFRPPSFVQTSRPAGVRGPRPTQTTMAYSQNGSIEQLLLNATIVGLRDVLFVEA